MAYNNYYPQYYQPQMQPQSQVQPQQTVSSGLVPVPSEMVARNYPVGFGQSVSFKDENLPFLYTKTMGFSQLEPPRFEKYRLVKEEAEVPHNEPETDYKGEIDSIWKAIDELKKKVSQYDAESV